MSEPVQSGTHGSLDTRERLVQAAVTCFANAGVRQTTMDEIASAAGVVRQTAYNYFDKAQLIEEVIGREARRVNAVARHGLDWSLRAGPLLAEAEVQLLRAARSSSHAEFLLTPNAIESVAEVIDGSRLLGSIGEEYWMPILGGLLARGELREGLKVAEAVRWLNFSHLVLTIRPSVLGGSDGEIRRMWLTYVVPALVPASTSPAE